MVDLGNEEGPRSKSAGPRSPPSENTKMKRQNNNYISNYIGHRSSKSENTKMTRQNNNYIGPRSPMSKKILK
jgi:hypothetical protein